MPRGWCGRPASGRCLSVCWCLLMIARRSRTTINLVNSNGGCSSGNSPRGVPPAKVSCMPCGWCGRPASGRSFSVCWCLQMIARRSRATINLVNSNAGCSSGNSPRGAPPTKVSCMPCGWCGRPASGRSFSVCWCLQMIARRSRATINLVNSNAGCSSGNSPRGAPPTKFRACLAVGAGGTSGRSSDACRRLLSIALRSRFDPGWERLLGAPFNPSPRGTSHYVSCMPRGWWEARPGAKLLRFGCRGRFVRSMSGASG